jgi:hypothetical protein
MYRCGAQNPLHGWVIKIAPAILGLLLNTPLYDHEHLCKYPERVQYLYHGQEDGLRMEPGVEINRGIQGSSRSAGPGLRNSRFKRNSSMEICQDLAWNVWGLSS